MSTLYLVATPIGNLGDLSPRAREVLSSVDFIAAEDTRVTQKLLNACELPKKPMISYYEHNRRARGEFVLILEGAPEEPETEQDEADRLSAAAEAVRRRVEQGQTQKDAVKAVSAETGVKKNALYRFVLDQA